MDGDGGNDSTEALHEVLAKTFELEIPYGSNFPWGTPYNYTDQLYLPLLEITLS